MARVGWVRTFFLPFIRCRFMTTAPRDKRDRSCKSQAVLQSLQVLPVFCQGASTRTCPRPPWAPSSPTPASARTARPSSWPSRTRSTCGTFPTGTGRAGIAPPPPPLPRGISCARVLEIVFLQVPTIFFILSLKILYRLPVFLL